jgi:hypothetical protein
LPNVKQLKAEIPSLFLGEKITLSNDGEPSLAIYRVQFSSSWLIGNFLFSSKLQNTIFLETMRKPGKLLRGE